MPDLIDIPESPSPRLMWLRRHGLSLFRSDRGLHACRNRAHTRISESDTEDGAILEYCERYGIKHYLVEAHETDIDQGAVSFD